MVQIIDSPNLGAGGAEVYGLQRREIEILDIFSVKSHGSDRINPRAFVHNMQQVNYIYCTGGQCKNLLFLHRQDLRMCKLSKL